MYLVKSLYDCTNNTSYTTLTSQMSFLNEHTHSCSTMESIHVNELTLNCNLTEN